MTAGPAAPPDRAARREALLDAADRIVSRDGPAASMASIAAAAGITKPVLYRHFGDKGGLYAALADRYTGLLLAELQAALAAGQDRRDRVVRTVRAYLRVIEAQPQVYRFLTSSGEAAASPAYVRSFTRRLADLLAAGMAAETGAPAVQAATWAHAVVGMVQSAGDWWLDDPQQSAEALAEELTDLLFGAYATRHRDRSDVED